MRASAGAGGCFLRQWVTCGGGVGGVLAERCGWTDPAFGRGRRPLSLAWANGHPWGCPPLADGAASARGPRPKDGSGRPCQTSATGFGVRVLSVRRGCSVAGCGEGRPRWAGPRSGGRCKGGVGGVGVGTKSSSAPVAWLRWTGRQPPIAANLPVLMRNRRFAAKQRRGRTASPLSTCGFTLGSSSPLRGIATRCTSRCRRSSCRPHRPCEGSQQTAHGFSSFLPVRSSSPLRGIATWGNGRCTHPGAPSSSPLRGIATLFVPGHGQALPMSSSPLRGIATR